MIIYTLKLTYTTYKLIVLPETAITVSRMITIISRSLHNDTEFSKVKEEGIA